MQNALKSIQNSGLEKIASGASSNVLNAIQSASAKTGVNFAYMVQQAAAESDFDPRAKARTSSATGLYQFIKSTWLNMVEKHGEKYGIDTDQPRWKLLKLRNDPKVASYMAAEFAAENQDILEERWGGKVGSTELYFAHFMGAGGASSFLKAHDENPTQKAALLFPKEAKANRNVFYDQRTGRTRSLSEVYNFFDKKFDVQGGEIVQASQDPRFREEGSGKSVENKNYSVVFIDGAKETITWNEPSADALQRLARARPEPSDFVKSLQKREERTYNYVPRTGRSPVPSYNLMANPASVLMLSQLDTPMK